MFKVPWWKIQSESKTHPLRTRHNRHALVASWTLDFDADSILLLMHSLKFMLVKHGKVFVLSLFWHKPLNKPWIELGYLFSSSANKALKYSVVLPSQVFTQQIFTLVQKINYKSHRISHLNINLLPHNCCVAPMVLRVNVMVLAVCMQSWQGISAEVVN